VRNGEINSTRHFLPFFGCVYRVNWKKEDCFVVVVGEGVCVYAREWVAEIVGVSAHNLYFVLEEANFSFSFDDSENENFSAALC
jgi:hypothetical protein